MKEKVNFEKEALFKTGFLVENKRDYIKREGKFKNRKLYSNQSQANCTFCEIIGNNPQLESYEIYRNTRFILFLNLFPYIPGHILISPITHLTNYDDFPADLLENFGAFLQKAIKLVKKVIKTESVNVGWNQGNDAGGSIKHWHAHIVPRFPSELSFMEIIAKSKPIIMSLETVQKKYKEEISIFDGY